MNKGRWKALMVGALAGILNGMFGAGGGMVLVPLLIGWVGLEEKKAFATSVAVMLPLSVVSLIVFGSRDGEVFSQALPYLIGGIVGGALTSVFFKKISAMWLHRVFSVLLLYGGIKAVLLL